MLLVANVVICFVAIRPSMPRLRPALNARFAIMLALGGCGGAREQPDEVFRGEFQCLFAIAQTIELEDAPAEPLGEVGVLVEAANGDLIVSDAFVPRVRRYDANGNMMKETGSYGEGPNEFRTIGGLVVDEGGSVIIVDPRLNRITILDEHLDPDTAFILAAQPTGPIFRLGGGFLLGTAPARRRSGLQWLTSDWQALWTLPSPVPSSATGNPYWGGFAISRVTTSSTFAVTGYSFGYPLHLYDERGALVDSLGRPPPTFRSVPVVSAGAFSGPGGSQRRERWLRSFDVIADITILDDSLLLVIHGELRFSEVTGRIWSDHHRIDVYSLGTRSKIAEDVPLPGGSRIVGSGRGGMYLLVDGPPGPWTVNRVVLTRDVANLGVETCALTANRIPPKAERVGVPPSDG